MGVIIIAMLRKSAPARFGVLALTRKYPSASQVISK